MGRHLQVALLAVCKYSPQTVEQLVEEEQTEL